MYALSAKSKNLDGAWEFLRYYLTQEYQDKIQEQEYNLPVLRSTFEKNVQDATKKPYYMDENGNKVEYDETYYINGEEILLPQLTQEQVDRIVSFVESVNKRGYYNEQSPISFRKKPEHTSQDRRVREMWQVSFRAVYRSM